MKQPKIVTKEFLAEKIKENPGRVIGRALLALFNNQTNAEQVYTTTIIQNGIGFAKPDARIGTIGARQFRSHGKLDKWVIEIWSKPARDGFPRVCKYAEQLNAIAVQKASEVLPVCSNAVLSAATKSTLV